MNIYYKISVVLLLLLGNWQCIDPLDIQPVEANRLLVIEGSISTQPGPHLIKVSKSAQYGSRAVDEIILETAATVIVRDEIGEQVFLTESRAGNYITPTGWQAKVGGQYTLLVTLANGERYSSLPEPIVAVPPLKEVVPVFKKQPALNEFEQVVGIELYARWDDPAEEDNFYIWETSGVYQINTFPENHVGQDFLGNPFPDPLDCCRICYITEENVNKELRIFKDNFSNGNEQNELLAFIKDDGGRFMETFMAVVKHSSLTKDAFQFYDVLKNQLSIDGDIFDPPTSTIRGNMINLDDPEEPVIGYFRASDVIIDTLFLPKAVLTDPSPARVINDDCRVLDNSTTTKPSYWPN